MVTGSEQSYSNVTTCNLTNNLHVHHTRLRWLTRKQNLMMGKHCTLVFTAEAFAKAGLSNPPTLEHPLKNNLVLDPKTESFWEGGGVIHRRELG